MGRGESVVVPHEFTFDPAKHEYRLGGRLLPSVGQVLKGMGLIHEGSEEAMRRGKAIHTAIALLARGRLDWSTVSDAILPYLTAYETFAGHAKFRPSRIEEPMYHMVYDFAGTPDLIGMVGDELWIVEVKSGQKEAWHELQTGAYLLLVESGRKEFIKRVGLYLDKFGNYSLWPHTNYYDGQTFLAFLTAWRWTHGNGDSGRLEAPGNGVEAQGGGPGGPG